MMKRSTFYTVGFFLMLIPFSPGLTSAQDSIKKVTILKNQDFNKLKKDRNLRLVDQKRIFEVRLILDSTQRTPTSLRLKWKATEYYLDDKVQLSLDDIDSVTAVKSSMTRSYLLLITLTPNGREKLAAFTKANVKKQIGIIINNRLMEVPHIQGQILGGHMEIIGLKSLKEAKDLARVITDAKGKGKE